MLNGPLHNMTFRILICLLHFYNCGNFYNVVIESRGRMIHFLLKWLLHLRYVYITIDVHLYVMPCIFEFGLSQTIIKLESTLPSKTYPNLIRPVHTPSCLPSHHLCYTDTPRGWRIVYLVRIGY
jgi:hypothetical protein